MTDLTPDQTQTELIERGGLVIASLVAHSWGGEAAITVGDLIAEIQRLDGVVERIGTNSRKQENGEYWWTYRLETVEEIEEYARDDRYPPTGEDR